MTFFVLSFIILSVTASFAWGKEPEPKGTEMLNTYGENMELDFKLLDRGNGGAVIDYAKFGAFVGLGTESYEYKLTDRKALAAEVGEGIYPNNSVYKDPAYRMLVSKGKLSGSQWDFVNRDNQQLAFYKWATTNDTPAVQQFYTARALERLGETEHAIKAYHAVAVHFPKQIGWTFFKTPLYMGRLAIDRIHYLTEKHPGLGLKLVDAKITVVNGYNFDITDDQFIVSPGRLVRVNPSELKRSRADISKLKIVQSLGGERSQVVRFENGHWQMRVAGKPFLIQAVAYSPTPVGQTPDRGYNLDSWQTADADGNGKIDGPYDAWVDKNRNLEQDADEAAVGDFQLMKEMGVNTIRLYHHAMNKELLRQMYRDYGIHVVMGDLLGMYAVGSGAEWFKGTDYTDAAQKEKMKESVRQMVEEYKDEPYVILWMLGNESNYGDVGDTVKDKVGFGSQAKYQLPEMYVFVNEVAAMIKSMDPSRPVGYSNGEVAGIDILSKSAEAIDVFGVNIYRGGEGFGRSFWEDAKEFLDKPVFITEYGCPAFYISKSLEYAEEKQKEYHQGNWEDILNNTAGLGAGSAIGGTVFEFVDEWWKAGPPPQFDPSQQDTAGQFQANFPDGWMHEEWLGVTSQGDGSQSPFMRQLRKSYDYYKEAWNE